MEHRHTVATALVWRGSLPGFASNIPFVHVVYILASWGAVSRDVGSDAGKDAGTSLRKTPGSPFYAGYFIGHKKGQIRLAQPSSKQCTHHAISLLRDVGELEPIYAERLPTMGLTAVIRLATSCKCIGLCGKELNVQDMARYISDHLPRSLVLYFSFMVLVLALKQVSLASVSFSFSRNDRTLRARR